MHLQPRLRVVLSCPSNRAHRLGDGRARPGSDVDDAAVADRLLPRRALGPGLLVEFNLGLDRCPRSGVVLLL